VEVAQVEARISFAKFRELAAADRLALPQLRAYDGTGRLRHDFGVGFAPDLAVELEPVLRAPRANERLPSTLAEEVAGLVGPDDAPLALAPGADLVFVQYWATWCVPCHHQLEVLRRALARTKELAVTILHVDTGAVAAK
jgi:hypothetical protein